MRLIVVRELFVGIVVGVVVRVSLPTQKREMDGGRSVLIQLSDAE